MPLAFSTAMEGQDIATRGSLLSSLPVDVCDHIFSMMGDDKRDLASLALVNSACRQAARTHQFRIVTLDGSHECEDGILALLQREAMERRDPANCGMTKNPSLGTCIRSIIASESGFKRYMAILWAAGELPPTVDPRQRQEEGVRRVAARLREHRLAIDYFNQVYRPTVSLVIASLPHLTHLKTMPTSDAGGFFLSPHLLHDLTGSTLRHLQLSVTMTKRCPLMDAGFTWPLSSLELHLSWDPSYRESKDFNPDASPYCQRILSLCCTTLEWLRMRVPSVPKNDKRYPDVSVSFDLRFPRLCQLNLLEASSLDPTALASLLTTSESLSVLAIDYTPQAAPQFADDVTVVQPSQLKYHAQSCTDVIYETAETRRLLDRLMPLISSCRALNNLALAFEGTEEPSSSLAAMPVFYAPSLERLSVRVGPASGPGSPGWLVQHANIRSWLWACAPRLRWLAFNRDAYESPLGRCCLFPVREHRARMAAEAERYGGVFPRLMMVYIGNMWFGLVRSGVSTVTARPVYPIVGGKVR